MNIKKIFLFGILPLFAVGLFFVNNKYVNAWDYGYCDSRPAWAVCGNGIWDTAWEQCDYGAANATTCTIPNSNPGSSCTYCTPGDICATNCQLVTRANGQCASSPYIYNSWWSAGTLCAFGNDSGFSANGSSASWTCSGVNGGLSTTCSGTNHYCGDGVVDTSNEQCDGSNLNGNTCESLGYYYGDAYCSSCSIAGCSGYYGDGICNGPETCSASPLDCVGNPSVSSVTASCTNNLVSITVAGSAPNCGFHSTAYSFDGGSTWQASNVYASGLSSYTQGANTVKIRDSYGNVSTAYASAVSQTCVTAPTTPNMSFVKDPGRGKGWITNLGGIAADGMTVYKYDFANSQRTAVFTQGTAFTATTSFSNVAVYSLSCPRKYVFEAVAFNTLSGTSTCPSAYSLSNKLCSPVRYVTTTIDYCTHHMLGF